MTDDEALGLALKVKRGEMKLKDVDPAHRGKVYANLHRTAKLAYLAREQRTSLRTFEKVGGFRIA